MRRMAFPAVLSVLIVTVWAQQPAPKRTVSDAEVDSVHRAALLIDTHNDVTSFTVDGLDIGPLRKEGHTDLPRLQKGNVGAQFFAVYVAASYAREHSAAHRALEMIDTVKRDIVARYPKQFEFSATADEIVAARKRGKIASLLGIEGGHAIEDSLRLLRTFYDQGVRYMTLTHSNSNNWADSSGDIEKPNNGLNAFGKQVISEMNRLGMMVDISHVSDKTFWDAVASSKAPVFASHSSCRSLANVPRNMTDEMIKALAKQGGVMQINFGCSFLSQRYVDQARPVSAAQRQRMAQLSETTRGMTPEQRREAFRKMMGSGESNGVKPATLADVVEHIDHVVKIAGVDYVGIGADFDGVGCVPEGLSDVSQYPNLTRALLEKGYSAQDIRKIYSENVLRVMRKVESVAKAEQAKGGPALSPELPRVSK